MFSGNQASQSKIESIKSSLLVEQETDMYTSQEWGDMDNMDLNVKQALYLSRKKKYHKHYTIVYSNNIKDQHVYNLNIQTSFLISYQQCITKSKL